MTSKPNSFRSVGLRRFVRVRSAARLFTVVVSAVVVLGGCGSNDAATSTEASVDMSAVRTFAIPSRDHVETPVSYPQSPPVGGDHNPAWQNCGVYAEAVPNELGVHSMEHGAVWITYRPDLSVAAVATIRSFADGRTHVLVSPVEGLGFPIVLSAWGVQLAVETPDDPRIGEFISTYEQGNQTPEPGAPCSGALGSPL